MVDRIREENSFSFSDIEQTLWIRMRLEFADTLGACLQRIDDHLFGLRDTERYVVKDFQPRTLATMLGQDVTFRRRRYWDTQEERSVYLLDEKLQIPRDQQISPGLSECLLTQAVTTGSYRKAKESTEAILGYPIASHETIRQVVLQTGSRLEQLGEERRQNSAGERQVKTLFMEVDGMHPSLQRDTKRSVEERVLTTYEGWERRYPTGKQKSYQLKDLDQVRFQAGGATAFWDAASCHVASQYDIMGDMLVVINGDRASWIREGVNWFPNAIYQIDRFHLIRELRQLFGAKSKTLKRLLTALGGDDVTGATFMAELACATAKLTDPEKHRKAEQLLKDLEDIPEATVDYRKRLRAMGRSTKGLRGLGAAESQVDRLSDRTKGRGRSWSRRGLAAMMELLCWRNTGRLSQVVDQVETWLETGEQTAEAVACAAGRAARHVLRDKVGIPKPNVPMMGAGHTASGGLANLFQRMTESGMPTAVT